MKSQKNKLIWVVLIVTSLLQLSCGFRLRGMVNISPEFLPIAVAADGVYIQLTPVLIRTLQGAGLSVVEVTAANSVLRLRSEHYAKKLLTVATSGESQTHSISYSVTFNVTRRFTQNDNVQKNLQLSNDDVSAKITPQDLSNNSARQSDEGLNQTVSVTRSFQFEKKAVLSSAAEEAIIKREMLTDAAHQILRRLNHLKTTVATPLNVESTESFKSEALNVNPLDAPQP